MLQLSIVMGNDEASMGEAQFPQFFCKFCAKAFALMAAPARHMAYDRAHYNNPKGSLGMAGGGKLAD